MLRPNAACWSDPAKRQGWLGYAAALLAFAAVGFTLVYEILRRQGLMPLNPQGFGEIITETGAGYRWLG